MEIVTLIMMACRSLISSSSPSDPTVVTTSDRRHVHRG
jgi:hypothetical protein